MSGSSTEASDEQPLKAPATTRVEPGGGEARPLEGPGPPGGLAPRGLQRGGELDGGERRAALEGQGAEAPHALGEPDGGERRAAVEGVRPERAHGPGHLDGAQRRVTGQGRVGDAHHLGAAELLGDGELGGVPRVSRHLNAAGGLLIAEPLLGGHGLQLCVAVRHLVGRRDVTCLAGIGGRWLAGRRDVVLRRLLRVPRSARRRLGRAKVQRLGGDLGVRAVRDHPHDQRHGQERRQDAPRGPHHATPLHTNHSSRKES